MDQAQKENVIMKLENVIHDRRPCDKRLLLLYIFLTKKKKKRKKDPFQNLSSFYLSECIEV